MRKILGYLGDSVYFGEDEHSVTGGKRIFLNNGFEDHTIIYLDRDVQEELLRELIISLGVDVAATMLDRIINKEGVNGG